jgi:RHS repeat-associated protein
MFDALGSTRQLVSYTGLVTDSYLYDSFGNILLTSGSTVNWWRYIGRQGYCFDVDLASYYVRARTYSQQLARWLSRDFAPFDHSSLSLYCYVGNDPFTLVDPSGRQAMLQPPTQKQQQACMDACAGARADPFSYGIPDTTIAFVLCMPAAFSSSAGQLSCACLGAQVANDYPSVKQCILKHEASHITSGDDVCDPSCSSPYVSTSHPPGYNQTTAECRAAAVEIVCLVQAFAKTTSYKERNQIAFHIQRERNYCKRLGGNIDTYLPPIFP